MLLISSWDAEWQSQNSRDTDTAVQPHHGVVQLSSSVMEHRMKDISPLGHSPDYNYFLIGLSELLAEYMCACTINVSVAGLYTSVA